MNADQAPEIGQRYAAVFSDCCIAGGFEATVTDVEMDADYVYEVAFDNGVKIDKTDALELTLIDVRTTEDRLRARADEIIVRVFEQEDVSYWQGDDVATSAWEHVRAIQERARRLDDPNFEKSGYAPRKAALAEQVDTLAALVFELRAALR